MEATMDTSTRIEPITSPAEDALLGFTWWDLGPDGLLTSSNGHRWSPGANGATCRLYPRYHRGRWRRLHPTGIPGTACPCGFRATFRPTPAGLHADVGPGTWSGVGRSVIGVIRGWGRAVVENGGWRSACARPVALYAAPAAQAELGSWARLEAATSRYDVPILRGYGQLVGLGHPSSQPARAA
jgi:hypothetical protein